ncbi:hypothetical protein AN3802.2 [Aspergillus nidulans FGSC A4]|uniref:Uncharacterized protein n=1 Tax=Emericella nidulans (strain FGSC A4 / ATCC 38163 / CBS 112.46 / NRRL 194 / M139) TaxID=227321 RepID=Q5B6M8_EMENI|nr:hypothetical protein [Aspergillus nidulans FGSC A4]EAA60010.1 hypothetical protein AN3802.2 [Aspergillus nidulans FGSC A4]CBF75352.1 TPA: conserved hypothetical protein [Aspergillus nidulans FGSC A4]|eukprot:XP_661406.1 hypothetical protein AN3802.2 [Aspergillus nidulans FGSC A4]
MAPVRRYLRISKFSVLECRIYLEDPSDTRWLLDSREPVLPRIFAAIRPLVLPKLREENERLYARKKGKPVKDIIAEEDFEVTVFLRESRTRHSLLTRHKDFEQPINKRTRTESSEENGGQADTGILVESDSESEVNMDAISQAGSEEEDNTTEGQRGKRKRNEQLQELHEGEDKKMRFRTNYEGFNIHGWMLCLLVTRKGNKERARIEAAEPKRQALMEEWISTQAQGDLDED